MFYLLDDRNEQTAKNLGAHWAKNNPMPLALIVEDDEDSRQMLKIVLEIWKYRVLEAKDGFEAIALAEEFCPDLILMDVKLPYFDGFEATRRLRKSPKAGSRTPVIFLSACVEVVYRAAASAAGGNAYLTKPVDFEELETILGKYINRQQNFAETARVENNYSQ